MPDPDLAAAAALIAAAFTTLARYEELWTEEQRARLTAPTRVDGTSASIERWLAPMTPDQLRAALETFRGATCAAAVLARLEPAPVGGSATGPWLLCGGNPIVNRSILWDSLPLLLDGDRRVMIVRGDRTSGKTYTNEVFTELGRRHRHCHVHYLQVAGASVHAIATALVRRLGGDVQQGPTKGESTVTWYVNELADWVRRLTCHPGHQDWLVLDGYDSAERDLECAQFFHKLAELVTGDRALPMGCRLVLLDHPEDLSRNVRRYQATELIPPIDELDVRRFFEVHWAGRPQQEIDGAVARVMRAANAAPDGERLVVLNEAIRVELEVG